MGFVVTLIGYVPPPRFDGVPWTSLQVEEASAVTGPWTLIDTQTFAEVDADPTAPASHNITTYQAQLEQAWYRVTFFDLAGGQSMPSDPENPNGVLTLPPTPDDVRSGSALLRAKYPLTASGQDPYAISDLRQLVGQATAMVQAITWRLIDPALGDLAPQPDYQSEAVPPGLAPVAVQAVTRMTERLKITTDPTFAEQVATGRRLRGFSAGPYSESYFAPGEFARRGASQGRPAVDPDDALDSALWALMTEDARDYFVWRASGVAPPTGVATAFDYRRETTGYHAGGPGFPYDGYGHGGPDGF